jgi:hypothetical protein
VDRPRSGPPAGTVYGSRAAAGEDGAPGQRRPGQHEGVGSGPGVPPDLDTGSLTGHILRQGTPDPTGAIHPGRGRVVVLLVLVGVLVAVALAGAVAWLTGAV